MSTENMERRIKWRNSNYLVGDIVSRKNNHTYELPIFDYSSERTRLYIISSVPRFSISNIPPDLDEVHRKLLGESFRLLNEQSISGSFYRKKRIYVDDSGNKIDLLYEPKKSEGDKYFMVTLYNPDMDFIEEVKWLFFDSANFPRYSLIELVWDFFSDNTPQLKSFFDQHVWHTDTLENSYISINVNRKKDFELLKKYPLPTYIASNDFVRLSLVIRRQWFRKFINEKTFHPYLLDLDFTDFIRFGTLDINKLAQHIIVHEKDKTMKMMMSDKLYETRIVNYVRTLDPRSLNVALEQISYESGDKINPCNVIETMDDWNWLIEEISYMQAFNLDGKYVRKLPKNIQPKFFSHNEINNCFVRDDT